MSLLESFLVKAPHLTFGLIQTSKKKRSTLILSFPFCSHFSDTLGHLFFSLIYAHVNWNLSSNAVHNKLRRNQSMQYWLSRQIWKPALLPEELNSTCGDIHILRLTPCTRAQLLRIYVGKLTPTRLRMKAQIQWTSSHLFRAEGRGANTREWEWNMLSEPVKEIKNSLRTVIHQMLSSILKESLRK